MSFRLPTALLEHDRSRSLRALRRYYLGEDGREPFVGRHFDSFGSPDATRFTSDDVVAVAFLSVSVPPAVVPSLVVTPSEEIQQCLADPQRMDADLRDVEPGSITESWPMWRLWTELRTHQGLGPTTTSKLLARKRPHLIPIWDSVIGVVVGPSEGHWVWLCEALRANGGELHDELLSLRDAAGLGPEISAIRTFDVIAWMEGKKNDL